ncbi:MAG: class I SAM-dependent methyltransferase [Verrucomicrobia bacterium]|nr:class I SAM-dependent methyltransferase [Verrucomicrobiota bacterium]MBS0636269.1 class I SAM-dependent methyltransferase [Verrucomicrobiota bacterium]
MYEIELPEIANGEDKSSAFVNCIRNSYRHIRKWAKRTSTNCFRIYDRELYHYPLAIDFYAGRYAVHYFSPTGDDIPDEVVQEVEKALYDIFRATPDAIFWRSRIRRKKYEQYEKQDEKKDFFTVLEYGVRFKVNLVDYLDTGLFLDHRETRQLVAKQAAGKRLLNLFSYTAAFSVQAAYHKAAYIKSVDMSNTYSDWALDNFKLNNLNPHDVVRADVMRFLEHETKKYDIIVIDPPTISRSKKMQGMFDIQEDYVVLLTRTLLLLLPGGKIYFSTNSRKFVFDEQLFSAVEITQKTLPIDFRDPKIHRVWRLERK